MKKENKVFEYGDLAVYCSKCKTTTLFEEESAKNIKHGIVITPNNFKVFKLYCPKCNEYMELKFVESKNPPKEEIKEEESGKETQHDNKEDI